MNRFNLMTFTAAVALAICACVSSTRLAGQQAAVAPKMTPLYMTARAGN